MKITTPRRVYEAISSDPWAIEPRKAREILDFLDLRAQGVAKSDEDIIAITHARRNRSGLASAGGVAVLPIFGVIAPRMDAMTALSGGTSIEGLAQRFDALMANDDVSTIVLHIDSPGGSVQGVAEMADKIFEARGRKRLIAVADGLMASAAYWIGSAADEVVATPTSLTGSIGVFSIHTDISRAEDAAGITRTIISAGRFKTEGNPHEPLSEEAEAHEQQLVDDYYDLFVEAVARQRGVEADAVRNGLGEGRVLTAERSVVEDLADRIATLEDVLVELGVKPSSLQATRSEEEPVDIAALSPGLGIAAGTTTVGTPSANAADVQIHTPDAPDAEAGGNAAAPNPTTPAPTAPSGQEDTVDKEDTAAQKNGAGTEDGGVATIEVNGGENERLRSAQIADLCAALGVPDRAGELIDSGKSVTEVREELRAQAEESLQAMTAPPVELTDDEVQRYSLCRAIMGVAEKGDGWSGFEREVSDEIKKNLPKNYDDHGGIFVPVTRGVVASDYVPRRNNALNRLQRAVQEDASIPILSRTRLLSQITHMQAALDSGTATAGQELMFTEAGDFIDLLRARMKVAQLGATILTGLQGNVAFPKQDGAGTFSWVAEDPGSDLADSDMTLTQVALDAKTGMSTTAYSRQLLAQGVVDVDMLVKNDLALITALGIDLAAINGGGGDEPTGVLGTTGIGDVDIGANGGAPTYEHMVDLETDVATANADIGSMAYLTTPGVRGKLKKTEEFATSNGRPVWTGGMEGEVNGYPAHVSTQVPSNLSDGTGSNLHAVLFGVWSQVILGYWGAYELIVDPFSKKKQALIELTSYQQAGIAVRHPASFSAVQDADPTA